MTIYRPDVWVVLKISNDEQVTYRVLAGWYGGYLGGDSWQINSGITKVEKEGPLIKFQGFSGSEYHCRDTNEKLSGMTSSIYDSLKSTQTEKASVEIVNFAEVDWSKI